MKRYTNHGVCHAFAHAAPGEGGQSGNGNLWFTGDTLYSYGEHYPVAVIIDRENRVALFNADSSSITTEAKHKNPARRALSHFTLHHMPDLDVITKAWRNGKLQMGGDLARYVDARAADMAKLAEKYLRLRADWTRGENLAAQAMHENAARMAWKLAGRRGDCFKIASKETRAELNRRRAQQLDSGLTLVRRAASVDVAERVAEFDHMTESCRAADMRDLARFEHEMQTRANVFPNVMPSGMGDKAARAAKPRAWLDSAIAEQEACHARNEPVHAAMLRLSRAISARRAELNRVDVDAWKRGENVRIPHNAGMHLRIKDDILETSQGARVPLQDAIALTRFAASRRIAGKAWRRNGERRRVGQFECDAITERGDIVAGCHRIPWDSIVDCVARHRAELPDAVKDAVLDGESV